MAKNRPTSSIKTGKGKGISYNQVSVKSAQTGRFVGVATAPSIGIKGKGRHTTDAQRIISETVSKVSGIITSMDADQKEIDALKATTRANLDKTQAILDTL